MRETQVVHDSVIVRVMRAHPFLEGIDSKRFGDIARNACRLDYRPGDYILRRGETADRLFLIWSGEVGLGFDTPERGFLQLDVLRGWEVLGWSWIVPPYRWRFDARASTTVGTVAIDANRLREEAGTQPSFRLKLFDRMVPLIAERLDLTQEHLFDVESRIVKNR